MWRDFTERLTEIEKPMVDFFVQILRAKVQSRVAGEEILEVGSGWGIFARSALEAFLTSKLTTIEKIPQVDKDFTKNTQGFEDRIRSLTGKPSFEVLPKLRKGGFQFVFIDGDHSFDGALADAILAWENLEDGGWMMFDDVFHKSNWKYEVEKKEFDFGVARAVWRFMYEKGIRDAEFHAYGTGGMILIQKPKAK